MASITEQPNELTRAIDQAEPLQLVRLLRQCDAQIFSGYDGLPGLADRPCLGAAVLAAEQAAALLRQHAQGQPVRIVLSGSGTSGRMAFLMARRFNAALRGRGLQPCFSYLCAGGDVALFSSREAPEDDWQCGVQRLRQATAACQQAMYIGITCGLSAPFVAGQLHYAMQPQQYQTGSTAAAAAAASAPPPHIVPVLLGFNPVERARTQVIEGWQYSFRDIAQQLAQRAAADGSGRSGIILNPVVGPEPVTGSTRMKGGTATKILLEVVLGMAWQAAFGGSEAEPPSIGLARDWLWRYEKGVRLAYTDEEQLAVAVDCMARSLRQGGRCIYLGRGVYGVEALVDASECPPTYNAAFDDVRAFVSGGYSTLANDEGNLAAQGESDLQLSWKYVREAAASKWTAKDTVIVVDGLEPWPSVVEGEADATGPGAAAAEAEDALLPELCRLAQQQGAAVVACLVGPALPSAAELAAMTGGVPLAACVQVPLSATDALVPAPVGFLAVAELAAKLLLNTLSTGGFVLKGKVMTNRMIDLQVGIGETAVANSVGVPVFKSLLLLFICRS